MASATRIASLAMASLMMSNSAIGADPEPQDAGSPGQTEGACRAAVTLTAERVSSVLGSDPTEGTPSTWVGLETDQPQAKPLDRRWRRISRSPFGGAYEPHAWTGSEMLVIQDERGRMASYDPADDSWTTRKSAPRSIAPFPPSVWTGSELVILEVEAHGGSIGGLAYAPASDTWRELRRSSFRMVDNLGTAAWTGARVVVIDSSKNVASYDPVADCWDPLPPVPGEVSGSRLYWSGSELLGETRRPSRLAPGAVAIATYDAVAGAWGEPAVSPLIEEASPTGGIWVDGVLVYLSWTHTDGLEGPWDAIYDPADATWTVFEHGCRTRSFGGIGGGGLIFSENGRRAFDPRTGQCYRIAKRPVRTGAGAALVWTGRELISWSGVISLPESPRPRGVMLRPPARLID